MPLQQALNDFSATIAAKPNLSDSDLLSKFPEFNNDPSLLQSAKDYAVTASSGKYSTTDALNSKFPEFFGAPSGVNAPAKQNFAITPEVQLNNYPSIDNATPQLSNQEANNVIYGNIPGTTKIGDVSILPIGKDWQQQAQTKAESDNNKSYPLQGVNAKLEPTKIGTIEGQSVEENQKEVQDEQDANAPAFSNGNLRHLYKVFNSGSKSMFSSIGTAIVDQAKQLQKLDPHTIHDDEFEKNQQTFQQAEEDLAKWKNTDAPKLKGTFGEAIVNMAPLVGLTAATLLTKSPQLAGATTAMFGEMGAGEGLQAADEWAKETGKSITEAQRQAAAVGYLAAYSLPVGEYLDKYLVKGAGKYVMGKMFTASPELLIKSGAQIIEAAAKQTPSFAKRLVSTAMNSALHGVGTMEAMDLTKMATDKLVLDKGVSYDEFKNRVIESAKAGVLFGLATAPFAATAMNKDIAERRANQKEVTFTLDNKGKSIELIPQNDGSLIGMKPDGSTTKVTQVMIDKSFTMTTDHFNQTVEAYKNDKSIDQNIDRSAFEKRIVQSLKNFQTTYGKILVATDVNGDKLYVHGKDEQGNLIGVDASGEVKLVDTSAQIESAPIGDVHQSIMAKYDEVKNFDPTPKGSDQQAIESTEPTPRSTESAIDPLQQHIDEINKNVAEHVTAYHNPDMGAVVSAKLVGTDEPIQVTGGKIVQNPDGTINENESDQAIYYKDENGVSQVVGLDKIEGIVENNPLNDAIQQTQAISTAPLIAQMQANQQTQQQEAAPVETLTPNVDSSVQNIDSSTPAPQVEEQPAQETPQSFSSQIPTSTIQNKKGETVKTVTNYEQVAPETTLGALQEKFETPEEIKAVVDAKIKRTEGEIAKIGKFRATGEIDTDTLNRKKAKEAISQANKELEYWNSVNDLMKAKAEEDRKKKNTETKFYEPKPKVLAQAPQLSELQEKFMNPSTRLEAATEIANQLEGAFNTNTKAQLKTSREEFIQGLSDLGLQGDKLNDVVDTINTGRVGGLFYKGQVLINLQDLASTDLFIKAWAHEQSHAVVNDNFTTEQLEAIYQKGGTKLADLYLNQLEKSYSKAAQADEILSYAVQRLFKDSGGFVDEHINFAPIPEAIREEVKQIINILKNGSRENNIGQPGRPSPDIGRSNGTGIEQTPGATQSGNGTSERAAQPSTVESSIKGKHNELVSKLKIYNSTPASYVGQRQEQFKKIQSLSQELDYSLTFHGKELVSVKDGNTIKTIAAKADKEAIEAHKLLTEYPKEVQDFTNLLFNTGGLSVHGLDLGGVNPIQAERNILEGKKTIASNGAIDILEAMVNSGMVTIRATKFSPAIEMPMQEYLNLITPEEKPIEKAILDHIPDEIYAKIYGLDKLSESEIEELNSYVRIGDEYINNYDNEINTRTDEDSTPKGIDDVAISGIEETKGNDREIDYSGKEQSRFIEKLTTEFPNGVKLYHRTTPEAWESIQKDGQLTASDSVAGTHTVLEDRDIQRVSPISNPIQLEISVPVSLYGELYPEENTYRDFTVETDDYTEDTFNEYLKEHPKLIGGDIIYNGDVPLSYVKRIDNSVNQQIESQKPNITPTEANTGVTKLTPELVTRNERKAELGAKIAAKIRKTPESEVRLQQIPSFDLELNAMGIEMSQIIFEEGNSSIEDYSKQMIDAIGEDIRPYIKMFYEMTRYYPGTNVKGLTEPKAVADFDIDGFNTAYSNEQPTEPIATKSEPKETAFQTSLFDDEPIKSKARAKKTTQKTDTTEKSNAVIKEEVKAKLPTKVTVKPEIGGEHGTEAEIINSVVGNEKKHLLHFPDGTEFWTNKDSLETINNTDHETNQPSLGIDSPLEAGAVSTGITTGNGTGRTKETANSDRKEGSVSDGLAINSHEKRREQGRGAGDSFNATRSELLPGTSGGDRNISIANGSNLQEVGGVVELKNSRNLIINRDEVVAPKGDVSKIKANFAAIKLAKKLNETGAIATPEQMTTLVKYTGWGGLAAAFKEDNPNYKTLRDALNDEDYESARASTTTSFYTPPSEVASIWDMIEKLGFKGGEILEPSAGIGHFFGLVPKHISSKSNLRGIELDNISGLILKSLYPDAKINIGGFEEQRIPNNSLDLVVSNVPFGAFKVHDKFDKDLSSKFDIHDYFIAKSVRKLKPGGIAVFVTTTSTLDKSSALRHWVINEGNADFIDAVRLNTETFKSSAGTEASSDIIIMRKRDTSEKSPYAVNMQDVATLREAGYTVDKKGSWGGIIGTEEKTAIMRVNKYFSENPHKVAGEMKFGFEGGNAIRPTEQRVAPVKGINQEEVISTFINSLPSNIYNTKKSVDKKSVDSDGTKEGGLTVINGIPHIINFGVATPTDWNTNKVAGHEKSVALQEYISIKNAIGKLLDAENKDLKDIEAYRKELNTVYDNFVSKFGYLSENNKLNFLKDDVDFPAIAAIETVKQLSKPGERKKEFKISKTDIFHTRVISKQQELKADNVTDGIKNSIYKLGQVDIPYISNMIGKSEAETKHEILSQRLGFENPSTGMIEERNHYLSGNVRQKLAIAEQANDEGVFNANVEELLKVIPNEIPIHLIKVSLGSTWVPVEAYNEFFKQTFDVTASIQKTSSDKFTAKLSNKGNAKDYEHGLAEAGVPGSTIALNAMNNSPTTVYRSEYVDGKRMSVKDAQATAQASTKQEELNEKFDSWAKSSDNSFSDKMERVYNDTFNTNTDKKIDVSSFQSFPGASSTKIPREHQKEGAVRSLQTPTLLAHEVGTGKTITLISAAMEMRRLGIAKKPCIVVQRSTFDQFVNEIKGLYPLAKVLVPSEKDLTAKERQSLFAKIAYNDWDIVVLYHSYLDKIPDDMDRVNQYIDDMIQEKMDLLNEVTNSEGDNSKRMAGSIKKEIENLTKKKSVKQEEKTKANASARAEKLMDRKLDNTMTFEQLGIDALLVDEAHAYKKLGFSTSLSGVKGIDVAASQRAQSMKLKTSYILDNNNNKNVVFATGTPISNTMAEMWTWMRYLLPKSELQRLQINNFDSFVNNFGTIAESAEFSTSGKFKITNRFASFSNVPELVSIWNRIAHTVLTESVATLKEGVGTPIVESGKPIDVFLKQTPALKSVMKGIKNTITEFENMSGRQKKENSHIPLVMFGLAKRAAIDVRLVDSSLPDDPGSKLNQTVREIVKDLKQTADYKGTIAVFCDSYQSKDKLFNVFSDIKQKLIDSGVPVEQIADISDYDNDKKRGELFEAINEGDIRVVMGTTEKLGVGVNIQKRLHMLIHMDAPTRPSDYQQRNGRIMRQGNFHLDWGKAIKILRIGVEQTLDVTGYQRLEIKKKFIDQIMKGDVNSRTLEEDESSDSNNFSEMMGNLSGSQAALAYSLEVNKLKKLENQSEYHEKNQIFMASAIKKNINIIGATGDAIKKLQKEKDEVKSIFPEGVVASVKIGTSDVAKTEDEVNNLLSKTINKRIDKEVELLRVDHSKTSTVLKSTIELNSKKFDLQINLKREYDAKANKSIVRKSIDYSSIDYPELSGNAGAKVENVINHVNEFISLRSFDDRIRQREVGLYKAEKENEAFKPQIGLKFPKVKELEEAKVKVDKLYEQMVEDLAKIEAQEHEENVEAINIDLEEESSDHRLQQLKNEVRLQQLPPNYNDFNGDVLAFAKATAKYYDRQAKKADKKATKEQVEKELKGEPFSIPKLADYVGRPFEEYLQAKQDYIDSIENVDLNGSAKTETPEIEKPSEIKDNPVTLIPGVTESAESYKRFKDSFVATFIPYKVGPDGKLAKEVMTHNLASLARRQEIAAETLKQAKRKFDNMTKFESLDFIDNMELGLAQPNEDLQKYADMLREALDTGRNNVQALGTGKLEDYIENYFPHMWENPKKAATILGKRPLEGSKNWMKKRTIATTREGVERGLIPATWNPVELSLLKVRDMERYVMAHETLNELKEAGTVVFVKSGSARPEGFVKINDKISTIQKMNEDKTSTILGFYYAQENAARIINNYLSEGLWGNQMYDIYRGLGNAITQFQLGLSAFHLGFTSMDATISKFAIGLEYLYQGQPIDALKRFAEIPTAPITNVRQGHKLMKAWYGNPATPELALVAEYMEQAGGRVQMDQFYANKFSDKIRDNIKNRRFVKAGLEVPLKLVELASKPILEWIVPRQKLGIFMDMAQYIDKTHPEYTFEQKRTALQNAWSSVDNRMGQLVYDNLFWNKVTKDIAMASVRSVGWNLGTFREIGGAPKESVNILLDALKGKRSDESHKLAYLISLMGITMLYGAIFQYLSSGEAPQDIKDYFFPRNGQTNDKGDASRISLPTYVKDLYAYGQEPFTTLKNKLSPVNGIVAQMMENKDYYGVKIANDDDPAYQKGVDYLKYFGSQLVPFGIRNVEKETSDRTIDKVLPFIGIVPAPYTMNMSEAEKAAYEIMISHLPVGGRTQEQKDQTDLKKSIEMNLRKTKGNTSELEAEIQKGAVSVETAKTILKEFQLTGIEKMVKRFDYTEAMYIYEKADDKEKQKLKPIVIEKLINQIKRNDLTKSERDILMEQFNKMAR